MFDRLVEDFCQFDGFLPDLYPYWDARLLKQEAQPAKKRGPQAGLADSERWLVLDGPLPPRMGLPDQPVWRQHQAGIKLPVT
jgi:hypothetical protein